MIWRVVAAVLGAALYVLAVLGAIAGSPGLTGLVITIPVLILAVAGFNWFQQWLGIKRRPPQFARPDLARKEGAGADGEPPR